MRIRALSVVASTFSISLLWKEEGGTDQYIGALTGPATTHSALLSVSLLVPPLAVVAVVVVPQHSFVPSLNCCCCTHKAHSMVGLVPFAVLVLPLPTHNQKTPCLGRAPGARMHTLLHMSSCSSFAKCAGLSVYTTKHKRKPQTVTSTSTINTVHPQCACH